MLGGISSPGTDGASVWCKGTPSAGGCCKRKFCLLLCVVDRSTSRSIVWAPGYNDIQRHSAAFFQPLSCFLNVFCEVDVQPFFFYFHKMKWLNNSDAWLSTEYTPPARKRLTEHTTRHFRTIHCRPSVTVLTCVEPYQAHTHAPCTMHHAGWKKKDRGSILFYPLPFPSVLCVHV